METTSGGGGPSSSSAADNNNNIIMSSTSSGQQNAIVRGTITYCLQIRTVADAFPPILEAVVTSGKTSVVVVAGGYLIFTALLLPFWLLSKAVSEIGVYILIVGTVFLVGRAIIRLIAFPGSSHRVSGEIEKEFAKYSVRMITSSANSAIDLATSIMGAKGSVGSGTASGGSNDKGGTTTTTINNLAYYEIPSLWKRAKSYRDRVLGVYAEVLHHVLQDRPDISSGDSVGSNSSSASSSRQHLNKYGNNVLVGDVGDLAGLTFEAKADGRVLLDHLERVISQLFTLEMQAKPFLENTSAMGGAKPQQGLPESARLIASSIMIQATELRDFVESLRPPSSAGADGTNSSSSADGDDSENLTVDAVRRRFEEQNGSVFDSLRSGLDSILPMLDPPLHTSIFGFDVQRGCMLSRYRGARQLWVQRPGGGMIDCIHIPARPSSTSAQHGGGGGNHRNNKAIMYCNPNAGLIEVATGMSLAGGNVVSSDTEGVVNDNCWADLYTNLGFDVYLFNYAGFGRSHGSGCFGIGKRGGEERHVKGVMGRIRRICHGTFCSFQPTPDSLRADGLAVATYLVSQRGVESLIIHGESIGGVAASGTARRLTENSLLKEKVALLICDRTFCNLEAVAQRLVGGWSGYAIRMLAPFWSTDVVGDFLAATCPKVVANDCADAIIADTSSLKSGISFWKEIKRGAAPTKGLGWLIDADLKYRMADWENVCVNDSRYVPLGLARTTAPVWPADKHISIEEGFHFAACVKRIGKLASIKKKKFVMMTSSGLIDAERAMEGCQAPIYLVWKYLGCCEGLCGSALGIAVKGGFDTTVSWLCSTLTFGGQTLVEAMEHRHKWTDEEACAKLGELGPVDPSDFDCRPPGYEAQESDTIVHPKPIPEVVDTLKKIREEYPNDEILLSVSHELAFAIDTLEYAAARLSSPVIVETNWKNRHMCPDGMMTVGSFLNLHCGHNNPFSDSERKRLKALLLQASKRSSSPSTTMIS